VARFDVIFWRDFNSTYKPCSVEVCNSLMDSITEIYASNIEKSEKRQGVHGNKGYKRIQYYWMHYQSKYIVPSHRPREVEPHTKYTP